jgi:hypothetical protein
MSVPAVRAIKNGRPDVHVTIAAPDKIARCGSSFRKWTRSFLCQNVASFSC